MPPIRRLSTMFSAYIKWSGLGEHEGMGATRRWWTTAGRQSVARDARHTHPPPSGDRHLWALPIYPQGVGKKVVVVLVWGAGSEKGMDIVGNGRRVLPKPPQPTAEADGVPDLGGLHPARLWVVVDG